MCCCAKNAFGPLPLAKPELRCTLATSNHAGSTYGCGCCTHQAEWKLFGTRLNASCQAVQLRNFTSPPTLGGRCYTATRYNVPQLIVIDSHNVTAHSYS